MSSNEVRQFYQMISEQYYRLRDGKGGQKMEWGDAWCPTCGAMKLHRFEYRERREIRRCCQCGVSREYRT